MIGNNSSLGNGLKLEVGDYVELGTLGSTVFDETNITFADPDHSCSLFVRFNSLPSGKKTVNKLTLSGSVNRFMDLRVQTDGSKIRLRWVNQRTDPSAQVVNIVTPYIIEVGRIYHIVLNAQTNDTSNWKIHIDKIEEGAGSLTFTSSLSTTPWSDEGIGSILSLGHNATPSGTADMTIYSAAYYSRALTLGEIETLYSNFNKALTISTTDLRCFCDFNQDRGIFIPDKSGNANSGINSGGVFVDAKGNTA